MEMVGLIYLFFMGISMLIGIATYLLEAFAIYRMGGKLGFKNPWLSFIPFANSYAFGRIAEKYQTADGKSSMKFSKILLGFKIALFSLIVAIIVAFIIFAVIMISSYPKDLSTITNRYQSNFDYSYSENLDGLDYLTSDNSSKGGVYNLYNEYAPQYEDYDYDEQYINDDPYDYTEDFIEDSLEFNPSVLILVLVIVFIYFLILGVALTNTVFVSIALWRIYALFDKKNATLYLVLSIFFSILRPIFLFVVSNKQYEAFNYIKLEPIAVPAVNPDEPSVVETTVEETIEPTAEQSTEPTNE